MSPYKPKRPCIHPGCPALAVRRGRCEQHAQQAEADYRRRHPDDRPSAAQRGYDAKWRRVRVAFLRKHPDCEWPGEEGHAPATEADHIVPLADGGTHDWDNLRAYCKPHHSRKTALYDGGYGREKR